MMVFEFVVIDVVLFASRSHTLPPELPGHGAKKSGKGKSERSNEE